jgi:hypothetical protein
MTSSAVGSSAAATSWLPAIENIGMWRLSSSCAKRARPSAPPASASAARSIAGEEDGLNVLLAGRGCCGLQQPVGHADDPRGGTVVGAGPEVNVTEASSLTGRSRRP